MKKKYFKTIYDVKTWLNIHVNQLSYTRNLVLTFALASLGFTINYFEKNKSQISSNTKIFVLISAGLFVLSVLCGLYIAISQSKNYRLYRIISRKIEQDPGSDEMEFDQSVFEKESAVCNAIEKANKALFPLQIWIFAAGIILVSYITFFS